MCSHVEHVLVFPWDDGELLFFSSSLLCGGELFIVLKNKGYLLEVFKMRFF